MQKENVGGKRFRENRQWEIQSKIVKLGEKMMSNILLVKSVEYQRRRGGQMPGLLKHFIKMARFSNRCLEKKIAKLKEELSNL